MATLLGITPLEQPLVYSVDRVNGRSYERTWIGTIASCQAIKAVEEPLAESVRLTVQGVRATLVARYAYQPGETEVPVETQELDTEAIQQSIFINKTFAVLPDNVVNEIRKNHENKPEDNANGSYSKAITDITAACAGNATHITLATKAFHLLNLGAESFENYAFTLTRTRNVSRSYGTSIDLDNINKLFTTVELQDITGNPHLFSVPSVSLTTEESAKNLFAGWRQKVCRVQDVSNGSRQMIEQWQLAKWSLDLYDRFAA